MGAMSDSPSAPPVAATPDARQRAELARALVELGLQGGVEVTRLAAELHHAIAAGPLALLPGFRPDHQRAPLAYRAVAASLSGLAELSRSAPTAAASGEAEALTPPWLRVLSVLNGVSGDRLEQRRSSLALPTTLCGEDGGVLEALDERAAVVTVFVHGLCGSDRDWRGAEHQECCAWLRARGGQVAWLRYNSGRSIPSVGRELSELLERLAPPRAALQLVGHSMGGLVLRAAFHHAARGRNAWLSRLTHAAYLGSPHHGAPLERAGNVLGALLPLTPYTRPFQRLAELRSHGIRDLRFGVVTEEDSARAALAVTDPRVALPPLPERAAHLLVAAELREGLGDGLVSAESALGLHASPALQLQAPHLQREHLLGLGHLALMSDARVYALLRGALGA